MRFAAVFSAILSLGLAVVAAPIAGGQRLDIAQRAPVDVIIPDVPAPLVVHVESEWAPVMMTQPRDEDFIAFLEDKQVKIKAATDAILAKTSAKETNIAAYQPHIDELNTHINDITVAAGAVNVFTDSIIVVHVLTAIFSDILKAFQSLIQLVEAGEMILKSLAPNIVKMLLSFNLNSAFLGFKIAAAALSGIFIKLFKAIGADLAELAGIKF